ncbi:folylpolyglutamate synthase, mitochondrial-like [Saccoglossus kowalevskii]|uniref:Folylpolyglutamate synthase n=1 Tax=Saccoglossus kowalevskii TaxID=10224 RepID=A0ABM0MZ64_SACKO|nr:PREDICTED: folylpolyglutamate synthase, mitochondrial-like [Saccoglossus kowalevskii]
MSDDNYWEALRILRTLPQNKELIKKVIEDGGWYASRQIPEFIDDLKRADITLDDIDGLSIIHVSGTKGKGSVCAFCESILRAHGIRTGFYSSPHLLEIRERFRINGVPLTRDDYSKYFFDVYRKLESSKDQFNGSMPFVATFQTIMAFHVFLQEKVEAVVLEVNVGGAYDVTNVVRDPVVTGINLLDLDHTDTLGDTLAKIAWHKAGICKPGRPAFTGPQPKEAMDALVARARELHAPIQLVPDLKDYDWQGQPMQLGLAGVHQQNNASLAIQLCKAWIEERNPSLSVMTPDSGSSKTHDDTLDDNIPTAPAFKLPDTFIYGLRNCHWPGRTQTIKRENSTYYLDGAHTRASIEACVKWFIQASAAEELSLKNAVARVLVFNCTRGRDEKVFIRNLMDCNFSAVAFSPNIIDAQCEEDLKDELIHIETIEEGREVCKANRNTWLTLEEQLSRETQSVSFECVMHALRWASCGKDSLMPKPRSEDPTPPQCIMEADHVQVLVTGSLHLVATVIKILDTHSMTNGK